MKRRGRPRKVPEEPTAINAYKVKMLKFPVTDQDDRQVECATCKAKMTFRQFRIHNMTEHYNIALTTDDDTEQDHNYYARRLMELRKLMKVSVFTCPNENCELNYKSPLGLGHHLVSCGKPIEEVQATYIQCDICQKRFPAANINWHKKTHTKPKKLVKSKTPEELCRKRASAAKAKEKLQKASKTKKKKKDNYGEGSNDEDDSDDGSASEGSYAAVSPSASDGDDVKTEVNDLSFLVATVLSKVPKATDKDDVSSETNIFDNISTNPLQALEEKDALAYLPKKLVSSPVKVTTALKPQKNIATKYVSTEFHRLKIFESEITDSEYGNNLIYCGGPVSAAAWSPKGTYLAVTTLADDTVIPVVSELVTRQSTIQIYENLYDPKSNVNEVNGLILKVLLGVKNGFIHHMVWSKFVPTPKEDSVCISNSDVIGHLAFATGDSSISIFFIENIYLNMEANLLVSNGVPKTVPFYVKAPELILVLNEISQEEAGQCTKFDWSEDLEYVAAGYSNGLVAVFNMRKVSRLLRRTIIDEGFNKSVEIKPIWYIRAHTGIVSALQFSYKNSNFFMTGSHDYFVKIWDLRMRAEMDSKKLGMVLDACWVMGWSHIAVSTEFLNLSTQMPNAPSVKFHPVGNSKGISNVTHAFNITTLAFFKGMLVEATELGQVVISFYDSYARDCDYERNKKKKNMIDFSSVNVESTTEGEEGIVLTIDHKRTEAAILGSEPGPKHVKDMILHYKQMRINKVLWSPSGLQLVVAYHNGFVTVTPASFRGFYGWATWHV